MKCRKPFISMLVIVTSLFLALQVFGKDTFDQDKFSELLMEEALEHNGLLALDIARQLQGVVNE